MEAYATYCFYIASLWLRWFLWEDRRSEVFAPSSLCVWSQMPWRSLQMIVSPRDVLYEHLIFDGLSKFVTSWIDFFESYFGSSKELSL